MVLAMSMFINNYMILNNEEFTEKKLTDITKEIIQKYRNKYCNNANAKIFYNENKKWVCIYFSGVFNSLYTLDSLKKHVSLLASHYGTAVIHNQVIETNSLAMIMHDDCVSDAYIIDRGDFLLYDCPDGPIIQMNIDKWKRLLEYDKDVVKQILEAEYDDESERLKALWVLLGFDEILVLCDDNSYDWLINYKPDMIKAFNIIDVRL